MPSSCQESSIACDDEGCATGNTSLLDLTNLAAGNYTLAVDTFSQFTLVIHVDGIIATGGSCALGIAAGHYLND